MAIKVKKALGDRVLIRRELPPKKIGVIELPDESIKNERIMTSKGRVIAVGPLCWKKEGMVDVQVTRPDGTVVTERAGEPWCEVGDRVLYQRYSGARIPDANTQDGYVEDLVFVLDKDIICTLEEDEEENGQNG